MNRNSVKPLKDLLNSVRDIDGFPIGKDEEILALSDPPAYTACPNPYIRDFIEEYGTPYNPETDDYRREPFVGDISEGKHHPIYTAHTYHTKVPHQAIQRFIEHYTEPSDIVFDGFCGTGMAGVAAVLSGRSAIVSELSPAATYIAYNLLNPISPDIFRKEFQEILEELKKECEWMYKTMHTKRAINTRTKEHPNFIDETEIEGDINYIVWNDVYKCPYCQNEICFGDSQDDGKPGEFKGKFTCPFCDAEIHENNSERVKIKKYDHYIEEEIEIVKQKPILVSYSIGTKNYWKKPDEHDLELINKIDEMEIPYWFPTNRMPDGYNTAQPARSHGITHVHHFFTKRNMWILSKLLSICKRKDMKYWFIINSIIQKASKLMTPKGDYVGRITPGTYYIAPLNMEINIFYYIKINLRTFPKYLEIMSNVKSKSMISTQSTTCLKNIPNNSIDYIFVDPPFGRNLMYSELNFMWEAFLRVISNNKKEAIENNVQGKDLHDYAELMTECFKEMYRILKPNRWITVEFHNTKASVWNSIQEAINRAGFIVAQVSVLDKRVGSFKQITSAGAVQGDLVINAYKPKSEFSERFLKSAGEGMESDFASQQLEHLPVRPNIERTDKMLYSKMLAHYVENGFKIGYNATNFYKLLSDNFTELDGYWFMDSQVKEYNKWKSGLSLDELRENLSGQRVLFVSDEKSALTWLYHFMENPLTFGEIQNEYRQVATTTDDTIPEVKELLENNFILEDGKYRRPLSEAERTEVEKNREKELDRAFNKLLKHARDGKGKIKNVRREALLHGFTKCYQDGRYQDILTVAEKLYKSTLESSGEIMDFIDIARIKTQGEKEVHAHE